MNQTIPLAIMGGILLAPGAGALLALAYLVAGRRQDALAAFLVPAVASAGAFCFGVLGLVVGYLFADVQGVDTGSATTATIEAAAFTLGALVGIVLGWREGRRLAGKIKSYFGR
ncbi:MAG: hypothetical protein ABIJ96_11170 [Elusimicrobiota bacterium]